MKSEPKTELPSSLPGHVWDLYAHRPGPGRAPYVNAIEYELTERGSRTAVLYLGGNNPRPVERVFIEGGRMTAKAVERAKAAMVEQLRERGYLGEVSE